MAYKRFVPSSHAPHRPQWKKGMSNIGPLLYFVLVVVLCVSLKPQPATKVSIDVTVSSLLWQNVQERSKDPDRYGFELFSNDSSLFTLQPATLSNLSEYNLDKRTVLFYPLKPFAPVQLHGLLFPDQASVWLTQVDSTRLRLAVSTAHTGSAAAILRWQLRFPRRGVLNAAGRLDTVGSAAANAYPVELALEKALNSGKTYNFEFIRPHPWKGPNQLKASSVEFIEANVQETEAISSVLKGTVKLLETNAPPIELAERDVLDVRFEKPVEIFLRGTPAGLVLHMDGLANHIWCGPKIMGEKNDQMPLIISTYHGASAYIAAALGALIPLLWKYFRLGKR